MGVTSAGVWDAGYRELLSPSPVSAGDNAFEDRTVINWADNSAVEDGYRVYRRAADEPGPLLGDFNTTGVARDVAISGDYAFVADNYSGLHVIDISDPSVPDSVGSYDTPGSAYGVAISGDYAFVADDSSGLHVIDISDPANPLLAGSYDTPGRAMGVVVAGNYAYVADYLSGLQIIDISDPTTLTLAGNYDTPSNAHGVAISGDYAYVADYNAGLLVLDISDPVAPVLVGSYDTPGPAWGVTISGNHAFVVDHTSGFHVIDISDPTAPELTGSYDTPGTALGVAISGDYAYVADGSPGLQVIDISDPTKLTLSWSYDTPGYAENIAIFGSIACVADGASGLQVIGINGELLETTDPNRTSFVDKTALSDSTYEYSVTAYDATSLGSGESAAASDEGLRTLKAPTLVTATDGQYEDRIEISWRDNSDWEDGYYIYRDGDPEPIGTEADNSISFIDYSPEFGIHHEYSVAAFDAIGPSEAAVDEGHTTLLAPVSFNASDVYEDRIEMTWVDRSEKESGFEIYRGSELIATLDEPDATSYSYAHIGINSFLDLDMDLGVDDVAVADDTAYVLSDGTHLLIIDNPANPESIGDYHDADGQFRAVAVAGDYAYLVGYDRLDVINISNPANPTLEGHFGVGGRDIAVAGDYAYVASSNDGLRIFYIHDPANPDTVSTYDTDDAMGVDISGNYAYVADGSAGLKIVDVSDPANPAAAGSCDTPDIAKEVYVSGDYAYVADENAGLQIIDVSDPLSPTLAGSYNTPGIAQDVAVSGDYAYVADGNGGNLQIIDISDPSKPSFAIFYDVESPSDVAVAGNYIYATNYNGLYIATKPLVTMGAPSEYCVQAYNGDVISDGSCDQGAMPVAVSDEVTTEIFLKLIGDDELAMNDYFGCSVSISGDWAIVGAWGENDYRGAVYFFERDADGEWSRKQRLVGTSTAAGTHFGRSVSIDGDRAIVGGDAHENVWAEDQGAAWIFVRDDAGVWSQETWIYASDRSGADAFGYSVSISGDRVIVGAPNDDSDTGSAYIWERGTSAWPVLETAKLTAEVDGGDFGSSVSISGDRAIVGADTSAYIFERGTGGWPATETQKIESTGGIYTTFGNSVCISGDRAFVGDFNGGDEQQGSAYFFERADGVWIEKQMLMASGGSAGERFGWSVSMSGDRIIIGADRALGGASWRQGASYIFEYDGQVWTQVQKLVAGDGSDSDQLGGSVSIDGDYAIMGVTESANAAYIAELAFAPGNVVASDGTLNSRVRITWVDRAVNERGFRIYRDGEPISTVNENVQGYEDYDAEPGRTYEYGVAALTNDVSAEVEQIKDFGWRPANGNIAGRISTIEGAASDSVWVEVTPLATDVESQQTKALLFDGNGGSVSVSDAAGTFSFRRNASYTIEAWVKYMGDGGSGAGAGTMIAKSSPESGAGSFPFSLSNMRPDSPGQLRFAIGDDGTPVEVLSDGTEFNDNKWHHVACVHDPDQMEIRLYVDSLPQGSTTYSSLGDITNDEPVTLGAGPEAGSWFGGQLDEIRIWNVVRADSAILAMMLKPLDGDEEGLVAYWPLDDVSNGIITDMTESAHYGTFEGGVYFTGDCAQLDIHPVTDIEGNFVLNGLYYGTEGEFEVRPFDGNRQFDPPVQRVVLTSESPVENQVIFSDISSYTISGTIRYADTDCPAVEISVMVDGLSGGSTDKNGKFAVAVDQGEHSIRPEADGHTFEPDSLIITVDNDVAVNDPVSGVAFNDLTTRTLSGRLGGGCGNNVGNITISIRSENNCFQRTWEFSAGDTAYSRDLPPQNYLVSASVASIEPGLNEIDVLEFFQNLGVRLAEMDTTDVEMDFVYRAPLVVTVEGFDAPPCQQLSIDGVQLPEGLPVIEQFEYVTLRITVGEDYGTSTPCKLDTGTVTIYDEISDQENTPISIPIVDGVAEYTTIGSTPSLLVGRVDGDGNNRSYQKAITFYASAEGIEADPVTEWVLVTGHVAQEGAPFVTLAGSVEPKYILRDPPGDNSYAYLKEGYKSCVVEDFNMDTWTKGNGLALDLKWGVHKGFILGMLTAIFEEVKVKKTNSFKLSAVRTSSTDSKTEVCFSFDEMFKTASSDLFTGEQGDVFIGAGTNYILAKVRVIDIEGCSVTDNLSLGVEPEGFHTTFAYTEQYIADVLIPELDATVANYISKGEADSAVLYQVAREDWQAMLELNTELKASSQLSENRSFSAGADYEYSYSEVTTESYVKKMTLMTSDDTSKGLLAEILGNDNTLTVSKSNSFSDVTDLTDTTGTETQTVGYVLSDDDIGDNFTVDVKNDGTYPSPVFDVLAGVSSCPWEPWPDTSGDARMVPRDSSVVEMTIRTLDNVPADEPAVFHLELNNYSQSSEIREYHLRLLSTSNPYGAMVKVNGALLNGPQSFFLEPALDGAAPLPLTLTVDRGPESYTYDGLKVIMYPPCEYANWENGGVLQKADTVTFNAHFQAPCSEITLYEPKDAWVYDKAMQQTTPDPTPLPIKLTGYDRDLGVLGDNISIEYIGASCRRLGSGDEAPGDWEICGAEIYYADLDVEYVTIDWLPPEALEDGVYEIRAFTHCSEGEGFSQSAIGTIDRHSPVVFGTPQPADGVLSFGENISITFNEAVDSLSIDEGDISLTYLDWPDPPGPAITFDAVCNGSTIVITPTSASGDLEGRRIEASVSGITDRIGNPLEAAVVWEFDYRKSQFAWSDADIVAEGALGNPGKLMAEMVNGTGEAVTFSFTHDLTLIAEIIPSTGTILPGETKLVELVVNTEISEGPHHGEVRAEATDGSNVSVAILTVDLNIGCQPPDWTVEPSGFEYSMPVVAELVIEGTPSTSRSDMVAAYVGGELRGVGSVDSVHVFDTDTGYDYSWLVFMTVYSNRPSGETIRYRIWDGSECTLYSSVDSNSSVRCEGTGRERQMILPRSRLLQVRQGPRR